MEAACKLDGSCEERGFRVNGSTFTGCGGRSPVISKAHRGRMCGQGKSRIHSNGGNQPRTFLPSPNNHLDRVCQGTLRISEAREYSIEEVHTGVKDLSRAECQDPLRWKYRRPTSPSRIIN